MPAAATVEALNAKNITAIGVGVIIVLIIVGFLIGLVITAIVGRLLIAVIVVVLGIFVWQQRSSVEDKISKDKCQLSTTFFGIHLNAPNDVKQACAAHTKQS